MPPRLASFLTLVFMFYLFRRDIREQKNVTNALWIPTLWLLVITTRAVSAWLGMYGLSAGGASLEGGSTVDALAYFGLIAAGTRVLVKRRISLSEVIRHNRMLSFYLAFCFIAVVWSDFPFVALKRWIKDLGHPIMVLILFTEPSFEEAFSRLLKRCAYVVVPVSILFVKYYPEWGRGFSEWTGQAYNTGITEGKNHLGSDCLILGTFFVWHLIMTLRREKSRARRDEILLCLGFVAMISWLFSIADSKTPLVSLFLALAILFLTGFRWVNLRLIGVYILAVAAIIIGAEVGFGISDSALEMLGRDASLTERTPLWEELRKWGAQNPILGTGFESFWLGARREKIWEIMRWNANQAHNGYLETYLNLGGVGLLFLLCCIATVYRKARLALLSDYWFGRLRFTFLFPILSYNWTEASLYGLHPVFFMFFLIAVDHPKAKIQTPRELSDSSSGSATSLVVCAEG
jgi:exopolysaccharide production protein ExoQ